MVQMVQEIAIHQTRNEAEALLLEGRLIKEYKPKYNTDFTDDKQFLMVQVDWQKDIHDFVCGETAWRMGHDIMDHLC